MREVFVRWLRSTCYRAARRSALRAARLRTEVLRTQERGSICSIQLERLNEVWEDAWRNVPYYSMIREKQGLPDRFRCLKEFCERVPILEKRHIQTNPEQFLRANGVPGRLVATGGSTGEPLRIGMWKWEGSIPGANQLIGRSWYGVVPGDKLFMVWGHSHLLGTGWRYRVKSAERHLKDLVLSYYRANAYHLDDAALSRMAREFQRFNPDYVIGYSTALRLLARHVNVSGLSGSKVVIGCAEGFAGQDDRESVSRAFNAPVSMEYGSVECGCIAHEHPKGNYRVFWDTHMVEPEHSESECVPILVTKLSKCYTPLMRYRIGDSVNLLDNEPGILTRFAKVMGRTNDYLQLRDGGRVHSEVIAHAVRDVSNVLQFQLVGRQGDPCILRIQSVKELTDGEKAFIRLKLARVSQELASLPIVQLSDLPKTRAGKLRWYIEEEDSDA